LIGLFPVKYVSNVRIITKAFSSGNSIFILIGRRKYGSTVRTLLKTFLPSRNMNSYYGSNVRILHDKPRRRRRRWLSFCWLSSSLAVVVVTNHRINGGAHRPEHACARTTPHRFSSAARLLRVAPSG